MTLRSVRTLSALRPPGLIIAGGRRPHAGCERRTRRAPGLLRSGQIGQMRQLPGPRLVILIRRRNIDRVMQPAVPAGRRHRTFGDPGIDDPAAFVAERRVLRPAAGAVITVAKLIGADQLALLPRVEERVE